MSDVNGVNGLPVHPHKFRCRRHNGYGVVRERHLYCERQFSAFIKNFDQTNGTGNSDSNLVASIVPCAEILRMSCPIISLCSECELFERLEHLRCFTKPERYPVACLVAIVSVTYVRVFRHRS